MKFDRACNHFGKFLKSLLLILSLMALGQAVFAADVSTVNQCFRQLTNNGQYDSTAFSLDLNELELREYGNDHLARATALVRETLKRKGCSKSAANFAQGPDREARSRCQEVVKGHEHTRVCVVESNLGYFFVTTDFLTTAHIIFNRWD